MDFYTNVINFGDHILVRGVKNGERITTRHKFQPTLYVPVQKQTSYKSLDGKYLAPVKQQSIKTARAFVQQYEYQPGLVYGMTRYHFQYISDTWRNEIKWNMDNILVVTIDIEVASDNGFPKVEDSIEELLSITIKNHQSKQIVVFGVGEFRNDRDDVHYVKCQDEDELIQKFLGFWETHKPDVVTGWNSKFYDLPYLIHRIKYRFGEDEIKRLSVWRSVFKDSIYIQGKEHICYNINGLEQLDYLDLYRKFTYSAQESYRLDHIAFVELGERKDPNPYDTYREWYTKDFQSFIEYNIKDVELVDRLEDKMKLIDLIFTMAYNAKCNYGDVFSQVRMWDVIMYNYLRNKNIQIPLIVRKDKGEMYTGAYVKDPQVGLHKWIVSFDLNSLYPHLIMQYNISPETIRGMHRTVPTVDKMLSQDFDTSFLKNETITPNGAMFDRSFCGFVPELLKEMYDNRKKTKKLMLKAQQEYENTKDPQLLNTISRLKNKQMAFKIALNSAYGAMGNQYFRFYDIRIAEAVTYGGQLSIRWIEVALNKYMNDLLETEDVDYVLASDTDSVYLTFESLIDKLKPKDPVKFLDTICNETIEKFIGEKYQELADYTNAYEQKMIMAREVIADKGIWTAKKRYILNVHNSEGVQYAEPKLKMMGIEAVKSSTPQVCRDKIKDALKLIISGTEKDLNTFIQDFRREWLELKPDMIAFPRSCNGLGKWATTNGIFKKGCPMHVKGALLYNYQLKEKNLIKKYPEIMEGEKIKFVYLKNPNPFQTNVFTFLTECPTELEVQKYVDYEKQFEKSYVEPLKFVTNSIGWMIDESYGTQTTLLDFFN